MEKRIFVAIKINPDKGFINIYDDFKNQLSSDRIKWVEMENIHITLKFFGETNVNLIPKISEICKNASNKINPFSMHLKGIGTFGNANNPKVIWLGISPVENLMPLHRQLHAGFENIGFEKDALFKPHLTLGRIKTLQNINSFENLKQKYQETVIQQFKVTEFHLYESILRPVGPIYKSLEVYNFKK